VQRPASASVPSANPLLRQGDGPFASRRGFSLVELVVVMGIVVILMSLLMPGLREVREATRRLQCGNHMRMIGIGIVAYGGDHLERMPYSRHAERKSFHDLMALSDTTGEPAFDGLGLLLPYRGGGYVGHRGCFFCPSHGGHHEVERNMPLLHRPGPVRVFGNFHYRGHLDRHGQRLLLGAEGDRMVVLTDGLRTRSDFNHVHGSNTLRSDGSVQWWYDTEDSVRRALPEQPVAEGPNPQFEAFFFDMLDRLSHASR